MIDNMVWLTADTAHVKSFLAYLLGYVRFAVLRFSTRPRGRCATRGLPGEDPIWQSTSTQSAGEFVVSTAHCGTRRAGSVTSAVAASSKAIRICPRCNYTCTADGKHFSDRTEDRRKDAALFHVSVEKLKCAAHFKERWVPCVSPINIDVRLPLLA